MEKVTVKLAAARYVDSKLRRPEEGNIKVSKEEADRIVADKAGEIVDEGKAPAKAKKAD